MSASLFTDSKATAHLTSAPNSASIHLGLSYWTQKGILPDPFFRIYTQHMHRAKHGSDSGVYDPEGEAR